MASEAAVADFDELPPTVENVEYVRHEEVHSTSTFPRNDTAPISFVISQRNDEYVRKFSKIETLM